MSTLGPIVDCNVHLWSQRHNPLFWLTDRTLVRDLIGNYDSLPTCTRSATPSARRRGSTCAGSCGQPPAQRIPSRRRNGCGDSTEQLGLVTGITSLGDPTAYGFGDLVDRLRRIRVVRSVRVRLATGLVQGAQHELTLLEQPAVIERLTLMARPARPRPSSSPRTKR